MSALSDAELAQARSKATKYYRLGQVTRVWSCSYLDEIMDLARERTT